MEMDFINKLLQEDQEEFKEEGGPSSLKGQVNSREFYKDTTLNSFIDEMKNRVNIDDYTNSKDQYFKFKFKGYEFEETLKSSLYDLYISVIFDIDISYDNTADCRDRKSKDSSNYYYYTNDHNIFHLMFNLFMRRKILAVPLSINEDLLLSKTRIIKRRYKKTFYKYKYVECIIERYNVINNKSIVFDSI